MKLLLIIWLGCLVVTAYHAAILRNSGIYPSKKVLHGKVMKWGIACALFFSIWIIILLVS